MELSFSKLKQKEVISVSDGKHLGKVCDIIFLYPENTIKGYTVTGGKGFKFTRQEVFIPVANIIKIGVDVILTNVNEKPDKKPPEKPCFPQPCPPQPCPPPPCPPCFKDNRRSYDEYE